MPEEVTFGTDAFNETAGQILNISLRFDNCDLALRGGHPCVKGSANDQQLLEVISAWGPLIYVGCFAATLRLDIKILNAYAIFSATRHYGALRAPPRLAAAPRVPLPGRLFFWGDLLESD